MVPVNSFRTSGKRRIVSESYESDNDIFLATQVLESLPHDFDELVANINSLIAVAKRCDQVPHSRASSVAIDVTQFANRFHTTDLDLLDLVRHEEFFQGNLLAHLVVPDFNLDTSIKRLALCSQIRSDRSCRTCPLVRYGFRRK